MASCTTDTPLLWQEGKHGFQAVALGLGSDRVNVAYSYPARKGGLLGEGSGQVSDPHASSRPPTPSCALQVKTIPPQRPEAAAGRGRPCIKHPPAQVSPLNGSFQRCRGERFMGGITQLPGGARAALAPVSRPSLSMPDTSALVAAHPESSGLWCREWLPSPVLCLPGLALGWFVEKDCGPEGTQTAPGLHPAAFPHCSHS